MSVENPKLYIIPTPIGNKKDITLRAIEILKEKKMIICEDTRNTKKLLNLLNISLKGKEFISFYKGKEKSKTKPIVEKILNEKEAVLLSDAGTPLISDPGVSLVKEAIKKRIKIISLPGPSSVLTGLIASGISSENGFAFLGFLPNSEEKIKRVFSRYLNLPLTTIFFESPKRIKKSMKILSNLFPGREIAVCRELTKMHEEIIRGRAEEIRDSLRDRELKGEITLVVEGIKKEKMPKNYDELLSVLLSSTTLSKKKIEKILKERFSKDRDISKLH